MYVGVRAGGGIGDEIEDPAGDPYELYRILFDITFFFFVIVILLAIIQGMYSQHRAGSGVGWMRPTYLKVNLAVHQTLELSRKSVKLGDYSQTVPSQLSSENNLL